MSRIFTEIFAWIDGILRFMPGAIGAGAVVNSDLPSGSIAVGVPARVVRRLETT